ncbi:MAG: fatty acid desaturase [Kiloniellales bacterium]|nr:fatty acid desaturase [Kiloniellales bacterium]
MATASEIGAFPLREARALVRDLATPKPHVYWLDFLVSVTLGWGAFGLALWAPSFSMLQLGSYLVAMLALYRAAIFIHELAHLKKGTFKLFRFVWNAVCGVPLLIPSFTYDGVHNHHHMRDVYGTKEDGEYLPFATGKPAEMLGFVLLSAVIPFLFLARFVLLTPISYLVPALRRFAWERASSLTIDFSYKRPENAIRNDEAWRIQEFATFVFASAVLTAVVWGVIPWKVLVLWYAISVMVFFLNALRTLAAHAYRNPGDEKMGVAEQYHDSVDIPGNPIISTLWAPVGLRFHATHHLFPGIPYHNLGEANRRLLEQLSDTRVPQATQRRGLWPALRQIWGESKARRKSADFGPEGSDRFSKEA